MADTELARVSGILDCARTPEEVFGVLSGSQSAMLEAARKIFWQLAKVVHPDLYQGTSSFDQAHGAFKKLSLLWDQAQVKIAHDSYGSVEIFKPFVLSTPTHSYAMERLLAVGDLCNLYVGTSSTTHKHYLFKVPLRPGDNDLATNENRILSYLRTSVEYDSIRHFVSQLFDTFLYQDQQSGSIRQINVLAYSRGFYSLQEVRKAYPCGIDHKDMAWIWRRLLVALDFAHSNGVIHGAVLPTHILIHPEQHGVMLIDWSYAVLTPATTGERISAISSAYRAWYPAEVFAKQVPTPGLDIFMAARCMLDLLGSNAAQGVIPSSLPWQLQNYLKACLLTNPASRPQDARLLLEAFDELIEQLWGPRTFRPFTMPVV